MPSFDKMSDCTHNPQNYSSLFISILGELSAQCVLMITRSYNLKLWVKNSYFTPHPPYHTMSSSASTPPLYVTHHKVRNFDSLNQLKIFSCFPTGQFFVVTIMKKGQCQPIKEVRDKKFLFSQTSSTVRK